MTNLCTILERAYVFPGVRPAIARLLQESAMTCPAPRIAPALQMNLWPVAFRRRDARQRSRLFVLLNPRLKHSPNSNRLC